MSGSPESVVYAFEGFELNARRRLLFRASGEQIPLPPKAFDTLLYLIERPGKVVDKNELMGAVWPNVIVEENNLNQAISAARRALGEHRGEHRFIVTEPGRGYRFVAAVRTSTEWATAKEYPGGQAPVERLHTEPRKPRHLRYIGVGVAIVVILSSVWFSQRDDQTTRLNSVAVLPFQNLSPDPDDAYFAAGMHEELLNQLAKVDGLNIIARASVLPYQDRDVPIREIAADLRVGAIMTGSLRYSDERIRVTLELIDATTGQQLWSETYEHDFDDIFAIESDIARNVATALRVELSLEEQESIMRVPTNSSDAYLAYLEAVALVRRDEGRAIELLEHALQLDNEFAPAYAMIAYLASRRLINTTLGGAADTRRPWAETTRVIFRNANRALALDPSLGIAYVAMGDTYEVFWRWAEAREAYRHAEEVSPNSAIVLYRYGWFSSFSGDFTEAIRLAERRIDVLPNLSFGYEDLGLAYAFSGEHEKAAAAYGLAATLNPDDLLVRLYLGYMQGLLGNAPVAESQFRFIEQSLGENRIITFLSALAIGYSLIERDDDVSRLVDEIEAASDKRAIGAGNYATAYLAARDREKTLGWLEVAAEKARRREPDQGFYDLMVIKHNVLSQDMLEEAPFLELRAELGHLE